MSKTNKHLRVLLLMSLFIALSIVLKLLAFPKSGLIRISFENLPILFAGITLGPVCGMIVGLSADLLGCVVLALEINPLVTLGAAATGLFGGLVFSLTKPMPLPIRIVLSALAAHAVGSLLIKSFGLAYLYNTIYPMVVVLRSYYLLIAIAEALLILTLFKSKVVNALYKMLGSKKRQE